MPMSRLSESLPRSGFALSGCIVTTFVLLVLFTVFVSIKISLSGCLMTLTVVELFVSSNLEAR
jgi:hypothetical protein